VYLVGVGKNTTDRYVVFFYTLKFTISTIDVRNKQEANLFVHGGGNFSFIKFM